jgi:diguanylate cyclase (GGDEF)-like protein
MIAAGVAMLALANTAIVQVAARAKVTYPGIFGSIWPIAVTSAVAIILVMSCLYKMLRLLVVELEGSEEAARHSALHDPLTGLPNRALLEDRLDQALRHHRREGASVAVLMLDLDRFKQVNDTLGHKAGDELVRQVADRFRALLRESDTVARIGGDEFAVLQVGPKGEEDVASLCDRMIEAVRAPFLIGGQEARVGLSIGAAMAGDGAANADDILRQADISLYRAKAAGRGCHRLFSREMDLEVRRRDLVEHKLREALEGGAIDVHFQPQINARTGALTGVEALMRWEDPELGQVSPAEAVPIAEECGMMDALGEHVFARVCEAARRWPALTVAVNLSSLQFRTPGLPGRLSEVAAGWGVDCVRIELEITERMVIEHGDLCRRAIEDLRAAGFRIALDDFGTGYSSLNYLRQFEVDKIKLDRSFLESAPRDRTLAIVRAAVMLGHAMELQVIAEGISERAQEEIAIQAGCDGLQGFLYAPPLAAADLDVFLKGRLAA